MHWFIIQRPFMLRISCDQIIVQLPELDNKNHCTVCTTVEMHSKLAFEYVWFVHTFKSYKKKYTKTINKSGNGFVQNWKFIQNKSPTIHSNTFTTNMFNRYNYLLTLMCMEWHGALANAKHRTCVHVIDRSQVATNRMGNAVSHKHTNRFAKLIFGKKAVCSICLPLFHSWLVIFGRICIVMCSL